MSKKILLEIYNQFLSKEQEYTNAVIKKLHNADYSNPTEGNQEAIGYVTGFTVARELLENELIKRNIIKK